MTGRQHSNSAGVTTWLRLGLILLVLGGSLLHAEAVFSEVFVIEGVKLYPDSREPDKFYYAPAGVEMKSVEGEPSFSFMRFRYIGSAATGDSGAFRGKALLTFTIRLDTQPDNLEVVEAELHRRLGHSVRLYPLPIVDVESDLVYSALGGGDSKTESGILGGGYWGRAEEENTGEVWNERTYYISADPLTADMLWQAYHNGTVLLSLNVAVESRGVKERPQGSVAGGETVTRTVFADAVPVSISPQRYPRLFVDYEIDAEMPAGYTFLDVYCYDFQEENRPEDLLAVDVEVRGRAMNGDLLVERIRFSVEEPEVFKRQVHFRYAVSLDSGYEYRIVRTYGTTGREIGAWEKVSDWSGICDVTTVQRTAGSPRDARPLDPRMLY